MDTATGAESGGGWCPEGAAFSDISGATPFGAFQASAAWYSVLYPLECSGLHSVYIVEDASAFLSAAEAAADDPGSLAVDRLTLTFASGMLSLGVHEVVFSLTFGEQSIVDYGTVTLSQIDVFPDEGDEAVMRGVVSIDAAGVVLQGEFTAPFCHPLADMCV